MGWATFVLAYIVSSIVLFVPGYLALRSLKLDAIKALCAAPLVSVAVIALLGIAYSLIGVRSNWISCVLIPIAVFGILCFSRLRSDNRSLFSALKGACDSDELPFLATYIVVGISFAVFFFAGNIDGADAFQPLSDNVFHLGLITTFAASGDYSMLHADVYPAGTPSPTVEAGFYPAGFHCVAATVLSLLGASTSLVENAVVAAVISLVFPLGNYLFFSEMLRSLAARNLGLYAGAFLGLMAIAFPWRFITWGPLFPNLLGMAMIPSAIGLLVSVRSFRKHAASWYLSRLLIVLLALFGLVAAHPNCVFTLMIIAVPFAAFRLALSASGAEHHANSKLISILKAAFVFLLGAFSWYALYKAPALQSTIGFSFWRSFEPSLARGLLDAVSLKLMGDAQPLLSILCAVGFAYTIRNWRKWGFLAIAFAVSAIQFAICASNDGVLRHLLTGFWYTDPNRVAANVALTGLPLSVFGFISIASLILDIRSSIGVSPIKQLSAVSAILAIILVAPVIHRVADNQSGLIPPYDPAGAYTASLQSLYAKWAPKSYDIEEESFVEEAKRIIGKDDLVINIPNDGSAFSYSLQGLNVYYKNWDVAFISSSGQTDQSVVIRTELNQIESNPDVRDVVHSIGAKYVLILDYGITDLDMTRTNFYYPDQWEGISSINDSTPGFKLLLSKDDMRLFEIVD